MKRLAVLALALLAISLSVHAASPCCTVTAIDARSGVITAKESATGRSFTFRLRDLNALRMLRVGQPVFANFAASEVSLDGKSAGGQIIGVAPAGGVADPGAPASSHAAPVSQNLNLPVGINPPAVVRDKTVDPCKLANAGFLQQVLQTGIQQFLPPNINNDGKHIDFSNPSIQQVTCPNLTLKLQLDVQYRETRGFPQFQTSGSMVIESPLVADVKYSSASGSTTVTAANLLQATAILSNPQITSLKIERVPSWLEPAFIRECLNGQHTDWGCKDVFQAVKFDITAYAKLYLEQGSTL